MKITSATFARGVTTINDMVTDNLPQIAFIGRSNVGKSSLINTITNHKGLARASSEAGRTVEVNFFLINKKFYFVDLPGYGFAKGNHEKREQIIDRIEGYLFDPRISHFKIVLIIDAKVGMTAQDISMFTDLIKNKKDVILVLNKIDKVNQKEKQKTINDISKYGSMFPIVQFSSTKKIGILELAKLISPK